MSQLPVKIATAALAAQGWRAELRARARHSGDPAADAGRTCYGALVNTPLAHGAELLCAAQLIDAFLEAVAELERAP